MSFLQILLELRRWLMNARIVSVVGLKREKISMKETVPVELGVEGGRHAMSVLDENRIFI
jgi:hypothetical protein